MELEMIVLDEHAVEQAHPMIHTAAAANRVLIEHAEAWRCFSSVHDSRARPPHKIDVFTRQRGNSAHTLQQIQRNAFGNEN